MAFPRPNPAAIKLLSDQELDWTSETEPSDNLAELQANLNALRDRLERPPAVLFDAPDVRHEGEVFYQKSGRHKWKHCYALLNSDRLTFQRSLQDSRVLKECEVCYFYITLADHETLKRQQEGRGAGQGRGTTPSSSSSPSRSAARSSTRRLHVITFGETFTMTLSDEAAFDGFVRALRVLLRQKFSLDELREKERCRRALEPLLVEEQRKIWLENARLERAFARTGLTVITQKKLREGYVFVLDDAPSSVEEGTSISLLDGDEALFAEAERLAQQEKASKQQPPPPELIPDRAPEPFIEDREVSSSSTSLHTGEPVEEASKRAHRYVRHYLVLTDDALALYRKGGSQDLKGKPEFRILLRYVISADYQPRRPQSFFVATALRRYVFRTAHEVAAQEWIEDIRHLTNLARGTPLPPLSFVPDQLTKHGYTYSKPVLGRMRLLEHPDGPLKPAKPIKHELAKKGPSTIGRSHQCVVTLNGDDKQISRQHCKIVVENNVPYLCDLGQCSYGTKLNGQAVVKAPLKPGDVITFGRSHTYCVFTVKEADRIFTESSPSGR